MKESALHGGATVRIGEGIAAGWINEENRQAVRQMLVYSDRVIMPPEVDTMAFTAALGEAGLQIPDALSTEISSLWEPSREPNVYRKHVSTLADIMHHPGVSMEEISATLDWWERLLTFEAKNNLDFSVGDDSPEARLALLFQSVREPLTKGRQEENELWKRLPSNLKSKLHAMSRDDPERENARFEKLNRVVRDAASFSVYSERLARTRLSDVCVTT